VVFATRSVVQRCRRDKLCNTLDHLPEYRKLNPRHRPLGQLERGRGTVVISAGPDVYRILRAFICLTQIQKRFARTGFRSHRDHSEGRNPLCALRFSGERLKEFEIYPETFRLEAISPIQNHSRYVQSAI
jgi:hypothetical protein